MLLNIPSIALKTQSIGLSSPISYLLFTLLGVLIFTNKTKFPKQIVFLAGISSLYFFIGSFQSNEGFIILFIVYVKFLLYIFGLFISLRHVNQNTIILLLLAGAITILLDSLYFRFNDFQGIDYVSKTGRYAGFYLNPNTASVVCLVGLVLSITKKDTWGIVLSIAFSFLGFLTLSRTFIIMWFLIIAIYLFYNRKHIINTFLFFGVALFILVTFSEKLNLDADRFEFLIGLFSGSVNEEVLNNDSRQNTWAKFYYDILDSPIIGNGYASFSKSSDGVGVHNTFLLILGESGFLPFVLFISVFVRLLYRTFRSIRYDISTFFLIITLTVMLLVNHNFFTDGLLIFILTFIIYKITQKTDIKII